MDDKTCEWCEGTGIVHRRDSDGWLLAVDCTDCKGGFSDIMADIAYEMAKDSVDKSFQRIERKVIELRDYLAKEEA